MVRKTRTMETVTRMDDQTCQYQLQAPSRPPRLPQWPPPNHHLNSNLRGHPLLLQHLRCQQNLRRYQNLSRRLRLNHQHPLFLLRLITNHLHHCHRLQTPSNLNLKTKTTLPENKFSHLILNPHLSLKSHLRLKLTISHLQKNRRCHLN